MLRIELRASSVNRHSAMLYEPIKEILGRLCGAIAGVVRLGDRPADKKHEPERPLLEITGDIFLSAARKLYDFHVDHDLTTASYEYLDELIKSSEIKKALAQKGKSGWNDFTSVMKHVFSYEGFRDSKKLILEDAEQGGKFFHWGKQDGDVGEWWGAWRFIKDSGIRYCPYCNADSVYSASFLTEEDSDKQKFIKSELDHFMPRSHYPFLAISLYNLIPSCRRCNGGVKGAVDVDFESCLYPYRDSIHDAVKFDCDPSAFKSYHGDGCGEALKIQERNGKGVQGKRALNFLSTFHLREVYHELFADEIIQEFRDVYEHSPLIARVLKADNPGITDKDIRRILFHRSLERDDINRVRFGKAFLDLRERLPA